MKSILFILSLLLFACTGNSEKDENQKYTSGSEKVVKKDSIITLEIHAKPGNQLFFSYMDPLFNFNIMQTPEKLKVDSIFRKEIVSQKPILLKDIHWKAKHYIYLIPGETYRITQDSLLSNFEIAGSPKRTYELNAQKELKKHIAKEKRISEFDFKELSRYQKFTKMDLHTRDSVLKSDYDNNIRFLDYYTSKVDFSPDQKKILNRNLFYQYKTAHFNFSKRTPNQVKKYLNENKLLYSELLPLMKCDSCFNDPEFPYLTQVFAKYYIADPEKVGIEKAYTLYNNHFTGKTKDFLLYSLIKLGGMFNETKPNPKLASQFKNDAQDPLLKGYIKEMYDFLETKKSATGNLANSAGTDMSWDKILNKYRGKVVYVDFWASWCGPCRAEVPASRLLKKHFKAKAVAFINISLDENSAAWKKASKSDGIDNQDNYILIQPDKSDLKKQFRITSIPRYFLIDKSGKIVNANASRPSDNKTAAEINSLL